ncbi:hypothetical protein [Ottowia sp.]|uniref:hypothetical protein n=1 Tax=Ottowia sp. TaxID=1898956 RepID=UPI002C091A93|nr:hypothetical protein [Ottowia sp.]HRN74803.1 hypothetical protein [Ottowia sp.]HRQ01955.1 hypothetical protein [Ottowia sp.]
MMKSLAFGLMASAFALSAAAADVSMAVPGAQNISGQKVLTFIAKDPPGQRCNGNLQVAAEIANTYRVPIQLLPASLAPGLPAPAVLYGNQVIVADGKDFNGAASYQIVADVLEMEAVPKHGKSGLLFQDGVRKDFDALKATIKAGGK